MNMSQRGTVNRSRSLNAGRGRGPIPRIQIKRPESAVPSSRLVPTPAERPRTSTPLGPVEHPQISSSTAGTSGDARSLLRGTSTPERGNVSSSSNLTNFLDNTNVSAIPTASTGGIPKTSQRGLLEERKQLKKAKEKKALLAQMQAVYSSCLRYEEQKDSENSGDQAKVDQLKKDIAGEEALINNYVTCLETIPLLKEQQAALDREKAERDEIMAILRGPEANDQSCSYEELAKIRKELGELKTSLDRVKGALVARKISFPIDGVEKILKEAASMFERMPDHKLVNRGMKKITQLATQLDQLVIKMDRLKQMLEEKDRLTVHLASLQTSLWLYKVKVENKSSRSH